MKIEQWKKDKIICDMFCQHGNQPCPPLILLLSLLLFNGADNVCVEQSDQRTGHNDSVLQDNTRVERGQC